MLKKIVITFLLLVQSTFYNHTTFAQDQKPQQEFYVSPFRTGHALSLFFSLEKTTWSLSQEPGQTPENMITSVSQTKYIPAVYLRYAYHMNLISRFGFFLGSTTGFIMGQGNFGALKPGYGLELPTVLIGLEADPTNRLRIFVCGEYGAIWFPEMTVTTNGNFQLGLSPVPDTFAVSGGFDYFFAKNTALLIQVGWRIVQMTQLNNGNYLNTLNLQNESTYAQIGMTWQINTF